MKVAVAAAQRALEASALSERDTIGLWTFATRLVGADDYQQQLPLAPADSGHKTAVRQKLQKTGPTAKDTGLYDTIHAGIRHLRDTAPAAADPPPFNLIIVLTDGQNDDAEPSVRLRDIGIELQKPGPEVQVNVIAAVGANCTPLDELVEQKVRCFDETRGGLDAAFAKVFPSDGR